MKTKPKNLKVSGLPSPRCGVSAAASELDQPGLLGCGQRKLLEPLAHLIQKRRASASCSKPTTMSSAYHAGSAERSR